jgi:biofilm protein TabA
MVLDVLANSERLKRLHPGFGAAFQFLRDTNLQQLGNGRQDIDGSRLFAMVIRGQGRGQASAKLEAHRQYIDIQYSVTGHDLIGWKNISACHQPEQPYDAEKDLQFFHDASDSWVTIPQGSFGIYFPEDAHAPMASDAPIHKVVVKIAVAWE